MIWPARRVWTGLAATWLLLLLANHSLRTGMPQRTAAIPTHPYGFILSLREQEQLMDEFNETAAPKKAGQSQSYPPQPRTERRGDSDMI